MMKIKKNFLDNKYFLDLKQNVIKSGNVPFYFQDTVASETEGRNKDNFFFTHVLYIKNKPNSRFFELFTPLLDKLKIKALIRMKINMYPRTQKIYHHAVHVDNLFKHKGCVFSLNTCDGGTQIGNKFIPSIENQALIFDSSVKHNSTTCTNASARFNVNINYF